MSIAVAAPARRTRLDLSWPILIGFAAVLCALIADPTAWTVVEEKPVRRGHADVGLVAPAYGADV